MKKNTAIALATLAALTLVSCKSAPKDTAVDPAADPAATDIADGSVTNDSVADGSVADGSVADGSVTGDGDEEDKLQDQVFNVAPGILQTGATTTERKLPGIIESTNPGARANAIPKGRQDPFSGRVILVRPLPPDPEIIDNTNFAVPDGTAAASQNFFPGTTASTAGSGASASRSGASVATGRSSGGGAATTTASRGGSGASSSSSRPTSTPKTTSRGSSGKSSGGSAGGSATVARGSSGSSSSSSKGASGSSATVSRGSSGSGSSAGGSTATASSGSSSSPTPQIAASPSDIELPDLTPREPIPDPTLARAVEVTGVIQVGSRYQAIVKAPDEPTSRYVSVGQRLSNGRVLVKRIESNGSEPVVILEESGVEVVRAIGAAGDGEGAQETAALPAPPAASI